MNLLNINRHINAFLRVVHLSVSLFLYLLQTVFAQLQGITKTYPYNFDPLKPHFYIAKLGYTGVYIIFLISAQKHGLCVLVRTASNKYPQSMFLSRNKKNIRIFSSENFQFLEVKFSIYLNRRVFVMG